jgi:hypothetical protein
MAKKRLDAIKKKKKEKVRRLITGSWQSFG